MRRSAGPGILTCVLELLVLVTAGCGGSSSPVSVTPPGPENQSTTLTPGPLTVNPQTGTLATAQTLQLAAKGTGSDQVTWSIDGAGSGVDWLGSVSPQGLYTAPASVPFPSLVVVRATSVTGTTASAAALITIFSPGEDWPKYRRDLFNSGVSGEAGINSANVSQLQLKWKFLSASPIVTSPAIATVNGVRAVYFGGAGGDAYALNADTGALIWHYQIDQLGPCAIYNEGCLLDSSPAVVNGIVYFGAGNGYVYALDALSGALVWKVQLGDPDLGYNVYTSPAVSNGIVYVGLASDDDAPCIPGQVVALDAKTGAQVWNFDTIDQSTCPGGNCVGAAVWSSPAVDVQFGTVYVGTGNPGATCDPSGPNATKYPDGMLALDAATGQFKSYSLLVAADTTDDDVGAAPILHQTQISNDCAGSGQVSYWVTMADKNGWVYTAPRGGAGLAGNPLGVRPGGELIAAPLALPSSKTSVCGHETQQSLQMDNQMFQVSSNGRFTILNLGTTGTLAISSYHALPACPSGTFCLDWSSPVAINDVVLVGGGDNALHAASTDGKMIWQFNTQAAVVSSPAISHGSVYFGSEDSYLYCLSLSGQ